MSPSHGVVEDTTIRAGGDLVKGVNLTSWRLEETISHKGLSFSCEAGKRAAREALEPQLGPAQVASGGDLEIKDCWVR